MKRSTKIAIQYMAFVWLFTTCLAILVSCAGKDGKDGLPGITGAPGSDGKDGSDLAPSPYDVVEIIDPCGKQAAYDEVLLRLRDGSLLAHYSDGAKQFFARIGPGTYRSTDGTSCIFSVGANGAVSW